MVKISATYSLLINILLIFLLLLVFGLEETVYRNELYTEKLEKDEENNFTEYLGMTYDLILGNPYGDPKLMVDLGIKRHILKKNKEDGIYVSHKTKELYCYYSKNSPIIRNINDLYKEFTYDDLDTQFDIHPFNASNQFRMLNERFQKGDLIVIYKNICSRYLVKLNERYKEFIDPFFISLLNEVSEFYQNIKYEKSKCDVYIYKRYQNNEACTKNIKPWLSFFFLYGTHLITGGYFGGEIINYLYAQDYSFLGFSLGFNKLNLNRRRLNPFYKNEDKFYFGTIIFRNKTTYLKEKHFRLYGGLDLHNIQGFENESYNKWKQSIKGELAKPIRFILTPFSEFIKSEEGKLAYFEALEFYSNLTYSDYNTPIFELTTDKKELHKMHIQKWKQSCVKNDVFNISLKCPTEHDAMISGFIITKVGTKFGTQLHLHLCPFSEECKSNINIEKDKNFEFGWSLCNKKTVHQEMKQLKKITKGNSELSCPHKMKIFFGFSFILKKSISEKIIMENCISNHKKCVTTKADEDSQNLIWINCINDDEEELLKTIVTKSFAQNVQLQKNTSYSLECPKGTFIISGFAVDFAPSDRGEGYVCPTGGSSCDLKVFCDRKNADEEHVPIIFIVCSSL